MKTNIYYLLLALMFVLMSCEEKSPSKTFENIATYDVMDIDSCEYIVYRSNAYRSTIVGITHKGNCKFCEERRYKLWKITK